MYEEIKTPLMNPILFPFFNERSHIHARCVNYFFTQFVGRLFQWTLRIMRDDT
jgi:hypothetical protein